MSDIITVAGLELRAFITRQQIAARLAELGALLAQRSYSEPPVMLGVLRGGAVFHADLIRACPFDLRVEYIQTKSYAGLRSTNSVSIQEASMQEIAGRDYLIVEDICDSGQTLQALEKYLYERGARTVFSIVLLDKPDARTVDYQPDLAGFTIPDRFVVGYGLDYKGLGRNLADIYQHVDS